MAFWHGRVLTATYFFRRRGIVVMISENFDGEWIARIIEQFGFRTSRGSSSRGGQRALLQLKREMEQGRPSGFAVDGPRGPARKAQPGAVWLAEADGQSGRAVSHGSLELLESEELGSHADSEAVLDSGAGGGRADRRARRCGRGEVIEAKRVEVEQRYTHSGAASLGRTTGSANPKSPVTNP